jgi:hypothetical protein
MIFWPFCAFIWFKNIEKMLLQMTSGFLQLESTIHCMYHEFLMPYVNLMSIVNKHLRVCQAYVHCE